MKNKKSELLKEEREFYKSLAKELIKTSISRIEDNSSKLLNAIGLIATLYAGLVGFWVTSKINLTIIGSLILAFPEILLIISAILCAQAIVPIQLKKINILSPDLTFQTYTEIVKYKSSRLKYSFIALILSLISILVVLVSLTLFKAYFINS